MIYVPVYVYTVIQHVIHVEASVKLLRSILTNKWLTNRNMQLYKGNFAHFDIWLSICFEHAFCNQHDIIS